MRRLLTVATNADIEAAREALKADIAALYGNCTPICGLSRRCLLTKLRDWRPWWRLRWSLGRNDGSLSANDRRRRLGVCRLW